MVPQWAFELNSTLPTAENWCLKGFVLKVTVPSSSQIARQPAIFNRILHIHIYIQGC